MSAVPVDGSQRRHLRALCLPTLKGSTPHTIPSSSRTRSRGARLDRSATLRRGRGRPSVPKHSRTGGNLHGRGRLGLGSNGGLRRRPDRLRLLRARAHPARPELLESARWSIFYIALALVFGVVVGMVWGWGRRHRVLRRVHHREEPLGRQPLRLPHHHDEVRGAAGVPAEGAAGRRRHRADPADGVHPGRRRRDRAVLLGVLHLRRVPRVHGGQAGPRAPRRRAPGPAGGA